MVTYAIGDIQGCARTLARLLERLRREAGFDDSRDALWLVGDLVNRGPRSLEALRWARAESEAGPLGERLVCVLGNHDLHLLACAAGASAPRDGDTLSAVLSAPDRDALVEWLRRRPLLHAAEVDGRPHVLVHAGLPPDWSVPQALSRGGELHAALAGDGWRETAAALRKRSPRRWRDDLAGAERLSAIAAGLTRLRTVKGSGQLVLRFKGPPSEAPRGSRPWFAAPGRAAAGHVVVCGHWAALGLHVSDAVLSIDSGCVWGGPLTAMRLAARPADRAVFQEPNAEG